MSIKKYETLLKTVDSGSLTRASEELGYTQSAISQMIKALEDELGLRLLIRDRSGVRLTDMGRELLPAIREVCEANDKVGRLAKELQGLAQGLLRIAIPTGLLSASLGQLLQSFCLDEPDLRFSLRQGRAGQMTHWLELGEVDAIFLPLRLKCNGLEHIALAAEPLLAFFPLSYPLADTAFPLTALREETLIVPEGQAGETMQTALLERDAAPKYTCSAQDDIAALAMVQAGLGLSLLPESLAGVSGVVTRPTEPSMARQLFFYYKDTQPPSNATRRFIRWLGGYLNTP